MINKKILIAAALALAIALNGGCSPANKPAGSDNTNITQPDKAKEQSIMKEYESILNKENNISEYISFVDKNIGALSPENASKLILKLEEIQKGYLGKLEDKYYAPDIQIKLDESFKPKYDLFNIDVNSVKDEGARALLEETIKLGYKLETAEGSFFPLIDYGFYEKYSAYGAQDIKDYIAVMIPESHKVPAKDAALVISWDELFERAFSQEKFLKEHKDSVKYEDVKALYKKYVTFAVYGLNNTPLFSYSDKNMNADAKAAYQKAIAKDTELGKALKAYYDNIEKDEFKLTKKIKSYQDEFIKNGKYMP